MLPDRVPLSEYQACGHALACSPDIVRAISIKETWLGQENPLDIRFEKAKWKKFRFASAAAKQFDGMKNSAERMKRWEQFEAMDTVCRSDAMLNRRADPAAILSHSFGWCQIMGFNHRAAGFEDPRNFLAAMRTLQGQRSAFVNFVRSDDTLHDAFRSENVARIALHYNGPAYRRNKYDTEVARIVAELRVDGGAFA